MDRLRKRFVMLVVPVALILFASLVVAQGPPNSCAKARVSGCASPLVIAECGIEVGVQIFSELLGFS